MAIYITGDCHGDWSRLNEENFPEQSGMTEEDFVIVTGDFGLWHDTEEERQRLRELNERSFTTLFLDGNHENFDRLGSGEFPEVDFRGGRAHQIRDRIYHLERGYVFTLCGKTFFVFGGARSRDIADGILDRASFENEEDFQRELRHQACRAKQCRINHETWWEEEMPCLAEMERARENLAACGNRVDYVLTHCGPQSVLSIYSEGTYPADPCTAFLDEIAGTVECKNWFFGHYHQNSQILIKYFMLFDRIMKIC